MIERADVVIVGGGIMGLSSAYNIVRNAPEMKVVVVERSTLGAGSSGKSSAVIRHHYSTSLLTRMAIRGRQVYENFAEIVGGGRIPYRRNGQVGLGSESQRTGMEHNVRIARDSGLDMKLVDPGELKDMVPFLNCEGVGVAFYDKDTGYISDSQQVLVGYARAAKTLGAIIYEGVEATKTTAASGKVKEVVTSAGSIRASTIINAAGPWSAELARTMHVNIPVRAERQQILILDADQQWPKDRSTISDFRTRLYLRPEPPGDVLVGWGASGAACDPNDYEEGYDYEVMVQMSERAAKLAPALGSAHVKTGYSGLYEVTPDQYPIIDGVKDVEGYLVVTGFSGHGFKLGPVVGELVAQIVLKRRPTYDLSLLSLKRFEEGRLIESSYGPSTYG